MSEERKFSMHEHLLRDVIERQAGSLDKAIMEAVMNLIEANATRGNFPSEGRGAPVSRRRSHRAVCPALWPAVSQMRRPSEQGRSSCRRVLPALLPGSLAHQAEPH